MAERLLALGKDRKADYRVGYHLLELFKKVGYADLCVNAYQPKYKTGEKKRYWELHYV